MALTYTSFSCEPHPSSFDTIAPLVMLSHLAQILSGQKVTVVRCEEINCSGSFFRNKLKYHDYLHSKSTLFLHLVHLVPWGYEALTDAVVEMCLSRLEGKEGSGHDLQS